MTTTDATDAFALDPQHSAFFVPEAWARDVRSALKAAGFKTSWQTAQARLLTFRALRVNLGKVLDRAARLDTALEIIFADMDLETFEGRSGDRIFPIVAPQNVLAQFEDASQKNSQDEAKLAHMAQAGYLPLMRRLAQVSGLPLTYHRHDERVMAPRVDDGIIHIYGNSCPPGEYQTWYRKTVFGLPVDPSKKNQVTGWGPTQGRGVILTDENDVLPVLQILGNTWYVLFPMTSYFNEFTSVLIFEQLLALGWDAIRKEVAPERPLSRRKFLSEASVWTKSSPTAMDERTQELREAIAQTTKRLAELHREYELWMGFAQGLENAPFTMRTKKALPGELKSIQQIPLVEGIDLYPEAIHVRTKPIVVSHEGIDYAVGTFVIRINRSGAVTVWSEIPTHPQGVPHPHITKQSGPCYGNAGMAIARAAGEARYADVIGYVLTWLTRGYSPTLTMNKIEEWPIVSTQEVTDAT